MLQPVKLASCIISAVDKPNAPEVAPMVVSLPMPTDLMLLFQKLRVNVPLFAPTSSPTLVEPLMLPAA